jgi:GTP:adenosylcobinamide-phosphate guanylyltransferase
LEHQALRENWKVVIAAGGRSDDQLAAAMGTASKALAPVAGVPSLLRVLLACSGYETAVVADEEVRAELGLTRVAEPGASSIGSIRSGLAMLSADGPTVFLPCDCPFIESADIEAFIGAIEARLGAAPPDKWFAAGLSSETAVRLRFPGADYRFLRFREGRFASGGLFAASRGGVQSALGVLERAAKGRKSQLQLALGFGLLPAARYLAGKISLREAELRAGKILGGTGYLIANCRPETTLDFDTPADWAYVTGASSGR